MEQRIKTPRLENHGTVKNWKKPSVASMQGTSGRVVSVEAGGETRARQYKACEKRPHMILASSQIVSRANTKVSTLPRGENSNPWTLLAISQTELITSKV